RSGGLRGRLPAGRAQGPHLLPPVGIGRGRGPQTRLRLCTQPLDGGVHIHHLDITSFSNARFASSPKTANTARVSDFAEKALASSTMTRAHSSSANPPTPVPNAGSASDSAPSS